MKNENIISWITITKSNNNNTATGFVYLTKSQTYENAIKDVFDDDDKKKILLLNMVKNIFQNRNTFYFEWNANEFLPFGSSQTKDEIANNIVE
ncbi:MAG: hypothetical protein GY755_11450 [Chloroflexi bacterium]|nr:hypothetical protein [Chloroflexota bacterium]